MPIRTVINNGNPNNRIDIVFMGDGYQQSELSTTFSSHASSFIEYIFNDSILTAPFGFYQKFFNFHLIDVASNQSGADDPINRITVDTAMNATYNFGGSTDRLLYIDDGIANSLMSNGLLGTGVSADIQVITVNSEKYGGAGGPFTVYAGGNSYALEVALHELAHSFSNLADEYGGNAGFYIGAEPAEVNVTTDPTGAKWSHWIGYDQPGIGVIGAYEGGRYFDSGIFRPSNASKMNVLNSPFDAVSREAFILKFYSIVNPIDDYSFSNTTETIKNPGSLWVDTIDEDIIQVEWFVDGVSTLQGLSNVTMMQLGLTSGEYVITAKALDGTDWVRQADRSSLEQDVVWNVSVKIVAGTAVDDVLFGTFDNDLIDGGLGIDIADYSGAQASHILTLSPTSTVIADRRADGNGTDTLINIERLDFDTGTFDLQKFGGTTGLSKQNFESFIEIYIAYFNRAPDAIGLNFWGTAFATGTSLEEIVTLFADQVETVATYPLGTTDSIFAGTVYNNVLGRTPDQAGFQFWVSQLDSGTVSRDEFILEVLRGVQAGSPDRSYLDTKIDIGAYYAVHKGMSDVANATAAMALFDGTGASVDASVAVVNGFYANASDPNNGEFLLQVVGVVDNPFELA